MAENNISSITGEPLMRSLNYRVILVEVFIALFLCINSVLITTFCMKDFFYTTMRYILFATTLTSDCLILIISNFLLLFDYFHLTMQIWLCLIMLILSSVYILVTPVTLTAMTLERYVAICMPLQHAELCSTRRALYCILIIHGLSSIPCIVILLISFLSASHSFYKQYKVCSLEVFIFYSWQSHLKAAINQLYFLIMSIIIIFCYVKIMKVVKSASGANKKSSWKGLRTVGLHAFQLLLCLIQLWCPFIETAVLQIDFMLYINVRYFNYITFYLAPRCLSPLIYGLRDEKFFLALKYYALRGLYKGICFHFSN
ncbi:odorant receptor 131-2-like [Mastacembelus armatus]|uniref:odorant receptor 131-2-like n=1 Tax=Mastacembelus armatus TaxID=205130 RepID=UPI000E457A6A|nr:odorant receptor 131-2-like [Mastacembelus armatus]